MPRLSLQLRRHGYNSGRFITSMTAPSTVLGLEVMSPRSVRMAFKRFVRDFKGFAKGEEAAEIGKAVVEVAKDWNLGVVRAA